jgi:16S rRNA (cytosine1402-N4)-methyltransferase
VLPDQVLRLLDPRPGQVMLDCTLGRGGHAAIIIPRLAPGGRYIGIDVDPANVAFVAAREQESRRAGEQEAERQTPTPTASTPAITAIPQTRTDFIRANFISARSVLDALGIARVDLLLADLGFASTQMDDPARGLSFMAEGPLDMRLDPGAPTTAAELVNKLSERDLADLIYRYGEERLSRRIARKIAEARRASPISTTLELARMVRAAYGSASHSQRIDPATRTFMALRIAVNAELEALAQLLACVPALVAPGGVAAIISFHSLEDRLVKQAFAQLHRSGQGERLTPKPLVADADEQQRNPRSRSAKLRALRIVVSGEPERPKADKPAAEDSQTLEMQAKALQG